MNEEIKEIIDMFTKYKDDWYSCEYKLKPKQCVAVLDYITNLQEENERLKDELEQNKNPLRGIFAQVTDDDLLRNNAAMYAELEDYKSRCEKANNILKDTNVDMPETLLIETIDYARHILNGGYEER